MSFKPMLACEADLDKLAFPMLASPKLDGIRASVVNGKLLTRTLKEVPNRYVFDALSDDRYEGLDGELIVGDSTSPEVYRNTVSGIMGRLGTPQVTYWAFDLHDVPSGFEGRYAELKQQFGTPTTDGVTIKLLPQALVRSIEDLLAFEDETVNLGYEGVILRGPNSPYKYGRSTVKEGYLLKLKRFEDSEAVVLGVEEEMFNGNEAETNELGRTKRSTAKAGLIGKGRMGKLHVRDVKTGVEFHVGTGFNDEDKAWWWADGGVGQLIKYKFFPVGVKDKPRHPVYLGLRDPIDA